jgi:lauroyl/myristoyl acyltransferase
VTFFGNETRFPAGTAVLALLAKCPILVGSMRRRPDGRFVGTILPPIEPIRSGNRDADVAATMQLVVANLEQIIRQAPHQWYMFRDMWPTAQVSEPQSRSLARQLAQYLAAIVSESTATKLLRSAVSAMHDFGFVPQSEQ